MVKAVRNSCNTLFKIANKKSGVPDKTCKVTKPLSNRIDLHFKDKILPKYGISSVTRNYQLLILRRFPSFQDNEPYEGKSSKSTHTNFINRFYEYKSFVNIEHRLIRYLEKSSNPLYIKDVQYINIKDAKGQNGLDDILHKAYMLRHKKGSDSFWNPSNIRTTDGKPTNGILDNITTRSTNLEKLSKKQMELSGRMFLKSLENNERRMLAFNKGVKKETEYPFTYHLGEEAKTLNYSLDDDQSKLLTIDSNTSGRISGRAITKRRDFNLNHQSIFLKDKDEGQTNHYSSEEKKLNYPVKSKKDKFQIMYQKNNEASGLPKYFNEEAGEGKQDSHNKDLIEHNSPSIFLKHINRSQTGGIFEKAYQRIPAITKNISPMKRERLMPEQKLVGRRAYEFLENKSDPKTVSMVLENNEENDFDSKGTELRFLQERKNTSKSLLLPLIKKNKQVGDIKDSTIKEPDSSNDTYSIHKKIEPGASKNTLTFRKPSIKEVAEPEEEPEGAEVYIKEDVLDKTYTLKKEKQNVKEFGDEEINLLADKVFKAIEKRIAIRKDKRGVW